MTDQDTPETPVSDMSSPEASGPENKRLTRGLKRGTLERTEALDWAGQKEGVGVPLFQKRIKVFPRRVTGRFRTIKWWFLTALLGIYYLTPWIRWDRGPLAPDQAVLIDAPARRFYFFWIEIWPQEVYYIAGILFMGAIGLFFATALFGRLWCAWGCPQTVWTDLFIFVERKIEGDRNARIRLDSAPWSMDKIRKKVTKHAIWLVISALTGGAWIFYFADAPTLARGLLDFSAVATHTTALGFMALFTGTTYLLAGHAREQVCTYMCPYSRFQSAMLDRESLIITYKADRGEARGALKRGEKREDKGDCVDCTLCVAVCPMGIDIRNGIQIECINCGLCADACNSVMNRVNLPKGLIGYDSLASVERRKNNLPEQSNLVRLLRPRTFIYGALLGVVAMAMVVSLATRSSVDVNVLKDRNPIFVLLSDGSIRNGYRVKVLNKVRAHQPYRISLSGVDGAVLNIPDGEAQPDGSWVVTAPPDAVGDFRLFVAAPKSMLTAERMPLTITVTDVADGTVAHEQTVFMGPKRGPKRGPK